METRNDLDPSTSSFLPYLLAAVLGGGICVLLIVATGGFFLYMLLAILGIMGFGYVHYLLWGRAMTEEVDREKAVEEARSSLANGYTWKPEETRFRER
jgi:hypothetical protein